jgi:ribosomal protein L11 methylase PrmA
MEWLDKRRGGVEKFGEWIELKTIVRLPEKIAGITRVFSEKFNLNQDVRVDKVERPDLFNQYEEHSVWWNIEEKDWLNKVNEGFEIIKGKGTSTHGSDTVILLPDKNFGLECVKHFETTKNIKVNHVFENEEEKRYHKHKKASQRHPCPLLANVMILCITKMVMQLFLFHPRSCPLCQRVHQ